ncbi:hypothetical protein GP475_10870 [Corynebacterium poyangense]|uniref:Uncharacterized protein n=1 Tax=Corynebacterium poyangense TaxID=2684405 RepID=A0A7H0SRA0_9CORY|nr:hypothetical protein [Corynebacterium poyangense]MBZ8176507.1 hypothetical protein [Corynebacterium poyangense]QNQ91075.1 hypothetical protein GP475_10870 [Corynebacterium poyangense]
METHTGVVPGDAPTTTGAPEVAKSFVDFVTNMGTWNALSSEGLIGQLFTVLKDFGAYAGNIAALLGLVK